MIIILNIKKALEAFHNNLQKDFDDNKVKDDILTIEKNIDYSAANIKGVEPILTKRIFRF